MPAAASRCSSSSRIGTRLTERIGFWIDLEHAYRTLDPDYIESVWWALRQIYDQGLLYEGHKVVPYCPRCGTALSSHEVALGYRDVVDPSVYVRLPLLGSEDKLLVWTTTPWTLPGNRAAAVGPEIEYVRARRGDETLIVAAALAERVLGEQFEVLERLPGSALVGKSYAGPIFASSDVEPGGFPIVAADFVTTDDGTGIVHIAPAFGQDDYDVGLANELVVYNPVKLDGTYDERLPAFAGRFVKDPKLTEDLIADLASRGLLFKQESFEHAYPHCWRCDTPLLYYAKPSWYIGTLARRDRLLAANETVAWHPEHIKHGRFGDWLAGNVDWALSRERYWGTPLPLWRCGSGHTVCIGSLAELEQRSGVALEDPHRPFVDDVLFACEDCGEPMKRVPEVIDVWFDSGAMPFAQHHHPFAGSEAFDRSFPADFVCEALDQTRGWFYSLLAISTLLFDRAPYRNVVCLGLILDEAGEKMSKSKGNVVDPFAMLDEFGADALRWYFFTSKQPWDGYRFSRRTIAEGVRQFLLPLWNVYYFYVTFARANGIADDVAGGSSHELDRWVLSRLQATTETVRERLDAYDATFAGRAIADFVEDLSNWYVRRSRPRFWDGDVEAFATLRRCLLDLCRLLAPFCPFVADELYDNLDGSQPSVHLCDFPVVELGLRDVELQADMATAREAVRLGLAARAQAKIKLRQPLRAVVVVASERERRAIERLESLVRDELQRQAAALRRRGGRAGAARVQAQLPPSRPALRRAHAGCRRRDRGARSRSRGRGVSRGARGRDLDRRPRPPARPRGPHARAGAAGGLPARARGLTRRCARAGARRRAAFGRDRARAGARGPGRAALRRPRRAGPDRAGARRRLRADRRRACARGLHRRRGAGDERRLRRVGVGVGRDGVCIDRRARAAGARDAGLSPRERVRRWVRNTHLTQTSPRVTSSRAAPGTPLPRSPAPPPPAGAARLRQRRLEARRRACASAVRRPAS